MLAPMIVGHPLNWMGRVAVAWISLTASIVTYFTVEERFRHGRPAPWKGLATGVALAAAVSVAAVAVIVTVPKLVGSGASITVAHADTATSAVVAEMRQAVAAGIATRNAPRNLTPALTVAATDRPVADTTNCHADFRTVTQGPCVRVRRPGRSAHRRADRRLARRRVAAALPYDERIGGRFLHAGLGFGGGCLPKDIRAFMARAGELGVDQALSFLKEIDAINLRRRARMVDLARELCGGTLAGMRVGVLGAAFKPNSDDIRDSPALDVALAVQQAGAAVRVYDPQAMDNARRDYPTLGYSDNAFAAVTGADVVLHLTEWSEFREMHPSQLAHVVAHRRIVDGRNALDRDLWRGEGWTYRALGRH